MDSEIGSKWWLCLRSEKVRDLSAPLLFSLYVGFSSQPKWIYIALCEFAMSSLHLSGRSSQKCSHIFLISNSTSRHFRWCLTTDSFIVVVPHSISQGDGDRSWMFAGQMNLNTIGTSSRDCHRLKYFYFTPDFFRALQRDWQLVRPRHYRIRLFTYCPPLHFLRGCQNHSMLWWRSSTAWYSMFKKICIAFG